MSLSPLLLLLLVGGSQASHFYGTTMTFNPKQYHNDGTVTVVFRYKTGFHPCSRSDFWECHSGDCGTQTSLVVETVEESSGEWCQREGIMTRQVPTSGSFQLRLDGGNWIKNQNNIVHWRASTQVDLMIRSDTSQANRSPQTTILPLLRVPSNCQRDFNLLAFDPDDDQVKCRFASGSEECANCTVPSVLSIQSNCTLSFSATSSSNEGSYAVQLVVEDFPRQSILLNNPLSKVPVQFAVRVDPAVPSCVAGQFLPRFLPPTPANGAQLYTSVNHTLEITVNTEATTSTVSELLVSGPHNIIENRLASGQFILRWTPSEAEDGDHHPICFVAQASLSSTKYHSEMRCVIVSVTAPPTTTAPPTITTTAAPPTTTTTTTTAPPTITAQLTITTTAAPRTTTTTTAPPTTTALPTTTTTTAPSTTTTTTAPSTTTTTTAPPTTTSGLSSTRLITIPSATVTLLIPTTITDMASTQSAVPRYILGLRVRISSAVPLTEEDIRSIVLQQLREELVRRGLPEDITLQLRGVQSA